MIPTAAATNLAPHGDEIDPHQDIHNTLGPRVTMPRLEVEDNSFSLKFFPVPPTGKSNKDPDIEKCFESLVNKNVVDTRTTCQNTFPKRVSDACGRDMSFGQTFSSPCSMTVPGGLEELTKTLSQVTSLRMDRTPVLQPEQIGHSNQPTKKNKQPIIVPDECLIDPNDMEDLFDDQEEGQRIERKCDGQTHLHGKSLLRDAFEALENRVPSTDESRVEGLIVPLSDQPCPNNEEQEQQQKHEKHEKCTFAFPDDIADGEYDDDESYDMCDKEINEMFKEIDIFDTDEDNLLSAGSIHDLPNQEGMSFNHEEQKSISPPLVEDTLEEENDITDEELNLIKKAADVFSDRREDNRCSEIMKQPEKRMNLHLPQRWSVPAISTTSAPADNQSRKGSAAMRSEKEMLLRLHRVMEKTQASQRCIQLWDRKMGLKRSHSSTMTKSTQSRREFRKMLLKMHSLEKDEKEELIRTERKYSKLASKATSSKPRKPSLSGRKRGRPSKADKSLDKSVQPNTIPITTELCHDFLPVSLGA